MSFHNQQSLQHHSQQLSSYTIQNIQSNTSNSFFFPITLLNQKKLSGKNQFKHLLKQEAGTSKNDKIWRYNKYKRKTKNGINCQYIRIRCRNCSAYIIYSEKESEWRLKNYKNHHIHDQLQQNKDSYSDKKDFGQYQNQKLHFPIYKLDQQRQIAKNRKLFLKNLDFSKVKILLQSLNYQFRFQINKKHNEDYPDILVAVSSEQKKSFQKYGQVISYDITYNCIKEVSKNGKRYGVGIFSGFDNNNRMLIFGFSITTFQKINDFKIIFKQFFNLIGYPYTTAIITDQQPSITSALKELKEEEKYKYHHIFDNWHFIRSFRSLLQGLQQDIKCDLINRLKRMMRQPDASIGFQYLRQIKQIMISLQLHTQYQRLSSKLEKVCMWKMPKQFIGLSLHSNQTLNHLLKIKVQVQVTIYELIQRLDSVSKQRINFCKNKRQYVPNALQNLFDDPQIKIIREKFEKKVFDKFLFYYNRSQFIIRINDNNNLNQQQKLKIKVKNLITAQQYLIQDQKCSCGTYQKIGLPCEHVIYVVKTHEYFSKSYIDLINQRWCPQYLNKKIR